MTQSSNGAAYQSFTYDAHDKLLTGTNEVVHWNLNGSETDTTLNGLLYRFTWDDEDRMSSLTTPGGITDTFTYNGLGLRVGKTDSTGTYAFVCDGTSPGSAVLSDGHATYTPGLSENRGGASTFRHGDQGGSLRFLTNSSQSVTGNLLSDAFGEHLSQSGVMATPYQYVGGGDCQTDADVGIILMGHRYYDPRIGRFLSQDPAGAGDNWYAYAGNNPTNENDPTGLSTEYDSNMAGSQYPGGGVSIPYMQDNYGTYDIYQVNNDGSSRYLSTYVNEPSMFDEMNGSGMGPILVSGKGYGSGNHSFDSKKQAKDAARNAGNGEPMYHAHDKDPNKPPHFHPVNRNGDKKWPGTHYSFPRKGNQPRPLKYDYTPKVGGEPEDDGPGIGGGSPVRMTPDGPVVMEDPAQEPDDN